jgi:hypothetical protein
MLGMAGETSNQLLQFQREYAAHRAAERCANGTAGIRRWDEQLTGVELAGADVGKRSLKRNE